MTLALEVAAGYVIGRFVVHIGSILAKVVSRRLVLASPVWQQRLRRDSELDERLKEAVGGRPSPS